MKTGLVLEDEDKIIVIRPSKDLKISRLEHDENKIKEQYELGREDALRKIEKIKQYINE